MSLRRLLLLSALLTFVLAATSAAQQGPTVKPKTGAWKGSAGGATVSFTVKRTKAGYSLRSVKVSAPQQCEVDKPDGTYDMVESTKTLSYPALKLRRHWEVQKARWVWGGTIDEQRRPRNAGDQGLLNQVGISLTTTSTSIGSGHFREYTSGPTGTPLNECDASWSVNARPAR